jgi:hypothetical protein
LSAQGDRQLSDRCRHEEHPEQADGECRDPEDDLIFPLEESVSWSAEHPVVQRVRGYESADSQINGQPDLQIHKTSFTPVEGAEPPECVSSYLRERSTPGFDDRMPHSVTSGETIASAAEL